MFAHRAGLVRAQSQVGQRLACADEREAILFVGGVVAARVGVVEPALDHLYGAGEIPALLAQAGQFDPRAPRGVEDMLLGAASDRFGAPVGELEFDPVLSDCRSPCSLSTAPRRESRGGSARTGGSRRRAPWRATR